MMVPWHAEGYQAHDLWLAAEVDEKLVDNRRSQFAEEFADIVLGSPIGIVVGAVFVLKVNLSSSEHNVSHDRMRWSGRRTRA